MKLDEFKHLQAELQSQLSPQRRIIIGLSEASYAIGCYFDKKRVSGLFTKMVREIIK